MTNTTKTKNMNAESSPTDNFENHSILKSEKRLIMQQSTGVDEVTVLHLHLCLKHSTKFNSWIPINALVLKIHVYI